MSYQEFVRWQLRYQRQPFGEVRRDMQAGIIASVIVNALREKHGKEVRPSDFILRFEEKKPQSSADMQALLRGLTERTGGIVYDHGKGNGRKS